MTTSWRRLLNWGTFVLIIVGAYLVAGPTSLGGPASYVLVDGTSMEPTYDSGDLVIAYQRDTYDSGDVIVYDAPVDQQFNVIHRITGRTEGGFLTQGDNMAREDGWIAPHEEIYGAAILHIPRGGVVVDFLRQPAMLFALLAAFLVFSFMSRQDDKRRDDSDEAVGHGRRRGTVT